MSIEIRIVHGVGTRDRYPIEDGQRLTFGRDSGCDIVVAPRNEYVSRLQGWLHAGPDFVVVGRTGVGDVWIDRGDGRHAFYLEQGRANVLDTAMGTILLAEPRARFAEEKSLTGVPVLAVHITTAPVLTENEDEDFDDDDREAPTQADVAQLRRHSTWNVLYELAKPLLLCEAGQIPSANVPRAHEIAAKLNYSSKTTANRITDWGATLKIRGDGNVPRFAIAVAAVRYGIVTAEDVRIHG